MHDGEGNKLTEYGVAGSWESIREVGTENNKSRKFAMIYGRSYPGKVNWVCTEVTEDGLNLLLWLPGGWPLRRDGPERDGGSRQIDTRTRGRHRKTYIQAGRS